MRAGSIYPTPTAVGQQSPRIRGWQWASLVIAWVVMMGVGYAAYERATTPAQTVPSGQIVPVQRGTISASVSTTGSVVADSNSKLTFKVSGKLADVLVQVGDSVKQGQPLARIDPTDLKLQVTQAQSQLSAAEAKLALIQQGSRKDEIAASQSSLNSAEANLAKVEAGPTAADIQAAQSTVASAQANLAAAQSKLATLQAEPNPDDVKAAQLSLEQAKNSLWSTQLSRDGTCGNGHTPQYQCDAANAQVAAAETAVTTAQANLDKVSQPATADDIKAAQQAVTSAQVSYNSAVANLAQVKAGPTAADIAAAKATVASAQSDLNLKQVPYTPADVQNAQAAVDQAKAALATAQNQLNDATLVAPFAGNIAAIAMNPGEQVGSSSSITLVDPKAVRVDTTVDESDVAKLELGQTADMTFDALPGQNFTGKVIAIDPSGTVQSGVVTYLVSLSVSNPTGLKPGMTANANIVYSSKDNVLMVPNRAIRAQGRSRVVTVETPTGTEVRPVQVGMSNDQNTEITSGLQQGDRVLIPNTSVSTPRVGGGGPGGFGGGARFFAGRGD